MGATRQGFGRTGARWRPFLTYHVATLTNAAFQKLPAGTVDTLLKPENKPVLTKVLTYHVVAGRLSSVDLKKQIKASDGTAALKTVGGGTLWVMMRGNDVLLKDEKRGMARLSRLLTGAAFIAAALFISSLATSAVAAGIATFAISIILAAAAWLARSGAPDVQPAFRYFSVGEVLDDFAKASSIAGTSSRV